MELSRLRTGLLSVGFLLVCSYGGKAATTPAMDLVDFDSWLPNHAVAATKCEQPCATECFQSVCNGVAADVARPPAGVLGSTDLPLSYNAGAVLSATPGPTVVDGDGGILHVEPRFWMKRFLLTVLLLGGLIRYLTSPTYRKFLTEVIDPLNW